MRVIAWRSFSPKLKDKSWCPLSLCFKEDRIGRPVAPNYLNHVTQRAVRREWGVLGLMGIISDGRADNKEWSSGGQTRSGPKEY